MTFIGLRDTEPTFINSIGTKWWLDKGTTSYAQQPDIHGTVLLVTFFLTEKENGIFMYVAIEDGAVVHRFTGIEAMGAWVDIRKLDMRLE